jgi:hypothetical protein
MSWCQTLLETRDEVVTRAERTCPVGRRIGNGACRRLRLTEAPSERGRECLGDALLGVGRQGGEERQREGA